MGLLYALNQKNASLDWLKIQNLLHCCNILEECTKVRLPRTVVCTHSLLAFYD